MEDKREERLREIERWERIHIRLSAVILAWLKGSSIGKAAAKMVGVTKMVVEEMNQKLLRVSIEI